MDCISQFSKPKKVWRYKDKKVKAPIVKHSVKVYVYRYFLEKSFENIYYFTENLNSELLYTIYKKTYYFLLENFLEKIIIINNYKRIIILNILLEKY